MQFTYHNLTQDPLIPPIFWSPGTHPESVLMWTMKSFLFVFLWDNYLEETLCNKWDFWAPYFGCIVYRDSKVHQEDKQVIKKNKKWSKHFGWHNMHRIVKCRVNYRKKPLSYWDMVFITKPGSKQSMPENHCAMIRIIQATSYGFRILKNLHWLQISETILNLNHDVNF